MFNIQKKNLVILPFSLAVHLAVIHSKHCYVLILLSCLSDGVWEAGIIYIDRSDHRAFPSLSVTCLFLLSQFPFPIYASAGLVRTNADTSAHPAPVPGRAGSAAALHCAHLFRHLQNSHCTPGWNISELKILEIYRLAPSPLWAFLLQCLSLISIRLSQGHVWHHSCKGDVDFRQGWSSGPRTPKFEHPKPLDYFGLLQLPSAYYRQN